MTKKLQMQREAMMKREMEALSNPYVDLPSRQYWRTGVAEQHVQTVTDLWTKKFDIKPKDRIATAGSCFAQHISKRLSRSGYDFMDVERAPPSLAPATHQAYGYATYSARYGNIYTTRQLLELAQEALGIIPSLDYTWTDGDAYFDPLRPAIEPGGYDSEKDLRHHRELHLQAVRRLLRDCDIFIFTLGLTEAWICKRSGRALPTAPGTIAGQFDPDLYELRNFTHSEILKDLNDFIKLMRKHNKADRLRYILTVSPVPLTATAMDQHVLVATTYSKSVLRAAAGELAASRKRVDYFPSYEVISSSWSRGFFFEQNLRSVTSAGVDAAMRVFFSQHPPLSTQRAEEKPVDDDIQCEEALLESFAR